MTRLAVSNRPSIGQHDERAEPRPPRRPRSTSAQIGWLAALGAAARGAPRRLAARPGSRRTSMPPLPRTISSSSEPAGGRASAACTGLPTTIRLTLRSRANASTASLTLSPRERRRSRRPAPRPASSWPASARRSGARERPAAPALSTYATIHSARSRAAMRQPARTRRVALGVGPHAHQDALRHRPGRLDLVVAAVVAHVRVDVLGGAAQRQLAQRQQVAAAEEAARAPARRARAGRPCPPRGAAAARPAGRSTNSTSSAASSTRSGTVSRTVDAGDLVDEVVEALHVLDVERRVDVDAGVAAAPRRPASAWRGAARRVGVGQLVEQQQPRACGAAPRRGRTRAARRRDTRPSARRQPLEAFGERRGLGAAVGLDPADDDVDALRRGAARAASSMA